MSRTPRDRGDWVTLLDGVRVSRHWMIRHTPQLLADWCEAVTAERRRTIGALILQSATELESEPRGADVDVNAEPAELAWWAVVHRIDTRLVHGQDWPPLAAALARANAAGCDVNHLLPALVAGTPLPDRHPAREVHWRLLEDCPAALPDLPVLPTSAETARSSTAPPVVHRSATRSHPPAAPAESRLRIRSLVGRRL